MRTFLFGGLVGLVGCGEATVDVDGDAPASRGGTVDVDQVVVEDAVLSHPTASFRAASERFDVPIDLLLSISAAETGGQMVAGEREIPGWEPAFGVMALRGDVLETGARLAGVSPDAARTEREANILAAAAWLDDEADRLEIDRDDLGAWAPVVAAYGQLPDAAAEAAYVWDAVYHQLQSGVLVEGYEAEPQAVVPQFPEPDPVRYVAPAERSYAIWRGSSNYSSRGGQTVEMVVIHACEGSYAGCWSWLRNTASGVSAHYVVNESGSEVSQLVYEADKAWHVGATYNCALNGNRECGLSGTGTNLFAVGIEHAGYSSQTSWQSGLLAKSAQLTCDITRTHGIPRDSYHIVAHGRLDPYNRTDPGAGWNWTDYLNRVNTACGTGTTASTSTSSTASLVIDSNNATNPTATRYVAPGTGWFSSTSVPGYYNTGYYAGSTQAISDPTRFWFYESASKCYKVEAWWTGGSNRGTSIPFIAYNAAGVELGRSNVNQQINGGRWNNIGTWRFTSGWNQVAISRWTTSGYYAIADAVRLTPASTCP